VPIRKFCFAQEVRLKARGKGVFFRFRAQPENEKTPLFLKAALPRIENV